MKVRNLLRSFGNTRASSTLPSKPTGDISSVFPSLSGNITTRLPPRFTALKARLKAGHEDALQASWHELLATLRDDVRTLNPIGDRRIPEIEFRDVENVEKCTEFSKEFRKRGVAVIRGVVSEQEALEGKRLLSDYIEMNPGVRGFPPDSPAVYELYWSPSQILARAHANILRVQSFLMSHWHSKDMSALISTSHPTTYADRLRIRQPGDTGFALGPHIDGGSCERWEEDGYGRGGVYNKIFEGEWQAYDPWESSCRLPVVSDLYNGAGACSMLRMFQGWLSMSEDPRPEEGKLLVNPTFAKATAYYLLRPFFKPKKSANELDGSVAVEGTDSEMESFLAANNWKMEEKATPVLQGAVPGSCQELNEALHPHLELAKTMVHIPRMKPGDYVAWHCDIIHAVDNVHKGRNDSSALYIPCCPLTEANVKYLVRQREAFWNGTPGPDFPSGKGERDFRGRLTPDYTMDNMSLEAQRAMGLAKYDASAQGIPPTELKMLQRANEILGFA